MKRPILFTLTLSLGITIVACNSTPQKAAVKKDSTAVNKDSIQYTCSMHPEVVSNKPGTCPKCGMDLTEKE
jgi:hypothetical protein